MSAIATSQPLGVPGRKLAGRQETVWVVAVAVLLVALLAYFCLAVPDFRELGVSGIFALTSSSSSSG